MIEATREDAASPTVEGVARFELRGMSLLRVASGAVPFDGVGGGEPSSVESRTLIVTLLGV